MEPTTDAWRRHFDPNTLESLQGLRLPAPRRTEGRLAGHRRNPRSGGSADFSQHREYVPGDDVRLVDWKVFARNDRFFLKLREDESNLQCHLLLDTSGSMAFRGPASNVDKLEFSRRWAAAVAFVALNNRDGISLSAFDTQPRLIVRSAGGGPGWIRVVAEGLDRLQIGGETDLGSVLSAAVSRLPRRGLVMLISDLLDEPQRVAAGIRGLARRGHQVIVVQVVDPAEIDLPWDGPIRFIGLEGEAAIDTEPGGIRRAYQQQREAADAVIRQACREVAAQWIVVTTDQSIAQSMRHWLTQGGTSLHVG